MDIKQRTVNLIDSLKAVCGNAGLGNDGNEYKIITEIFLYKFLNDKFASQIKKNPAYGARISKAENGMPNTTLSPTTRWKTFGRIWTTIRRGCVPNTLWDISTTLPNKPDLATPSTARFWTSPTSTPTFFRWQVLAKPKSLSLSALLH